jgi:hypothetical protein
MHTVASNKKERKTYAYEFPKAGATWPMKKTGTVVASSRAEARKELVKRGILQPFESKVTQITPLKR